MRDSFLSGSHLEKHRMPISCWPVWAEAMEQQGWGVMEIQQIELTEKKSYPYTNCMDFLVIRITACFCWPQLFICTCTSNTWENAHFYICEKNLNRVGNNISLVSMLVFLLPDSWILWLICCLRMLVFSKTDAMWGHGGLMTTQEHMSRQIYIYIYI